MQVFSWSIVDLVMQCTSILRKLAMKTRNVAAKSTICSKMPKIRPNPVSHPRDKKKNETETEKVQLDVDHDRQRSAMEELFGSDGARRVYAIEANMMSDFGKYCDNEAPQLWPCLTINMKFDF